jgi:hypothetical protein
MRRRIRGRSSLGVFVITVLVGCHGQQPRVAPASRASTSACPSDTLVAVGPVPVPPVPDSLLGDRGAIVGAVFDPAGRGVIYATVIAYRVVDSTRVMQAHADTKADGLFQLGGLEPGRYVISARRLGLVTVQTRATVRPNAVSALVIRMCFDHLKLGPSTVN